MAGLGYDGGSKGRGRGMGIQFVKSSETLHSDSASGGSHPALCPASVQPGILGPKARPNPYSPNAAVAQYRDNSGGFVSPGSSGVFRFGQAFGKPGNDNYQSSMPASKPGHKNDYKMPGSVNLAKGASKSAPASSANFARTPVAQPILSKDEYYALWKNEKDEMLQKFRKLAYEVVNLKSDRPNAKDKLHSAANRVPIRIEFNTETVFGGKGSNSFLCYVFVDGVTVASGVALKVKDSKTNAYEAALQKLLMPHIRIVKLDPESSELQGSKTPFTSPPPQPSQTPFKKSYARLPPSAQSSAQTSKSTSDVPSQHKESNMEVACMKRRFNEHKSLEEFVIVEPLIPIPDCTPAHTLRRSADFNHMLLEYEYFFRGEAARCVLKIEDQILADVNGGSKVAAKNTAATQALRKLKKICWVIKTKKPVDSDTKISKEDMLNELSEQSDGISHDNIGNKLLRKMGWEGGGVGKDGSGIAEPVELKSVLNREGLGLSAQRGITDEFRKRVKEVIENYASSENQEDLVFAFDFRLDERQIIHDECRRLNLRSKCRGKGQQRYLCVRRKRSANQLFQHIMSCGGETARYVLVPPGSDLGNGLVLMSKNNVRDARGGRGQEDRHGIGRNSDKNTNAFQAKPVMGLTLNGPQATSQGGIPRNGPTFQNSVSMEGSNPLFQGVPKMPGNGVGSGQSGQGNRPTSIMSNSQNIEGQGITVRNIGNMSGNASQWRRPENSGNLFGNEFGCGVMSSGNNQGKGNNQMAAQNMRNCQMGMQNMGNRQIGIQVMGNSQMGMQNIRNSRMGMQNMRSNQMGQQNIANNQMGMQNMGNSQMGIPNMGNNQMGLQSMGNNQIGFQNIGNCQMGMQNMGNNQMQLQNMGRNQMGLQNVGRNQQVGMQNMGHNQFGMPFDDEGGGAGNLANGTQFTQNVNGGMGYQQAHPGVQWGSEAGQWGTGVGNRWQQGPRGTGNGCR